MEREELSRVLLVDLDRDANLVAVIEESLCARYCLVREGMREAPGHVEFVDWRDQNVVAAIVCVSTIDATTEKLVAAKLSDLKELPVLLATSTADLSILSQLPRTGWDFVVTPVCADEVVFRLQRRLSSWHSGSDRLEPRTKESPAVAQFARENVAFRDALDLVARMASCNSDQERELLRVMAKAVLRSRGLAVSRGEPTVLLRAIGKRMALVLTTVPLTNVPLSPREAAVAKRIGNAQGNKGIAEELGIAESTVQKYLRSVFQKLGVSTRAGVAGRMALLSLVLDDEQRDSDHGSE